MGKTTTLIIGLVILAALIGGGYWLSNNYQVNPSQESSDITADNTATNTVSSTPDDTKSATGDSNLKTFSNAAIGVSFSYPAAFTPIENQENSYSFYIPGPPNSYQILSDRLGVHLTNKTFSYNNPSYGSSGGEITINEVEKVTVAGVAGHKYEDGDAGCSSTIYAFPNKAGKAVRFSFAYCQDDQRVITPSMQTTILNSLKRI